MSTPVSFSGVRMERVRYIVEPSGENDIIPSSHSVFSSPSTASGLCHSPRSFLRTIQMSLRFIPVISLRLVPVTFSFVVVK